MKVTVGITMGDPAGIGPEIVLKALSNSEIYEVCKPIVIGDFNTLHQIAIQLKLSEKLRRIKHLQDSSGKRGVVEIIDLSNVKMEKLRMGTPSIEGGKASMEYIERAVMYALNGAIDAIATAPINKQSIALAGSEHIGHTELIGALTSSRDPLTMFWIQDVAIFFLSRHLPLRKAIELVKKDRLVSLTVKIIQFLKKIGIDEPRICIAALNPHAGDGGLIGDEEEREIIPAIIEVKEKGINLLGPIAADTVFYKAFILKQYDAILSLYHDQGHIPAKTFDFHGTVSVTLGLPFIRTSVDHGTAFDIAGRGIANSENLEKAIKVAADLTIKLKR